METKALLLKEELLIIKGGISNYEGLSDITSKGEYEGLSDITAKELEDLKDLV